MLHFMASQNVWPSYIDRLNEKYPMRPDRSQVAGRAMLTKSVVRVEDVLADPDYDQQFPAMMQWRRMLGVPLMREGVPRGVLVVGWAEPGQIPKAQEEMLKTFADQGAIAIENVRLFDEVQARTKELTESLQQQTATADVLKVISRSAFELPPILQVLVESASRLCDAERAAIFLLKDGQNHFAAHSGYPPEVVAFATANPIPHGLGISGRASREARTIHVVDATRELAEDSGAGYDRAEWQGRTGTRSALGVPLMRGQVAIGSFVLARSVVKPFTSKQIELVTTFADQAVIAIENVRLFDEVQARTKELTESLEQQTATSEVLGVISRSTTELQPVLDAIVSTAARLCGAEYAVVLRYDGEVLRLVAAKGSTPEQTKFVLEHPLPLTRGTITGRAALERSAVQVADVLADPEFDQLDAQRLGKQRTALGVPLLRKGGGLLGVISLMRREVKPFTDKQIDLVTTFADQAVIAIENVRLFDEVQARTKELTESLQQQTATADVLKVISRSAFELQPVLDVLVETAAALCDADHAYVFRRNGEVYGLAASHGFSQDYVDYLASQRIPVGRNTLVGRTALTAGIVHIPDAATDPEYTWHESQRRGGFHTMLGVPLLRDGVPIGVVALTRCAISPFTQKQIDLVNTFADQAVIAIENVRLFDEVQARTKELTRSVEELRALGEVTQAVNSTLELQKVLDTIVAKAVQLSGTDAGAIYVFSNQRQKFRLRATYGMSEEMIEAIGQQTIRLGDGPIGEAAVARRPVQAADLREEGLSPNLSVVYGAGYRALLAIPLMRLDRVVGALVVRRRAPGAFADATVSLLETFAAQSVLAIQNARLFADIEEKGRQLEMASQHKSQFLANMSHELRTPMNAVLGFAEMLADGLYGELPPKARGALVRVQANGKHLLGLINDVLDLSKIEAGQLQLALDDYSIGQVVQTVMAGTEALARNKGLKLTASVKDGMPLGYGDERRLTQVLLNLVGNAIKFTDEGEVAIEAKAAGGLFELSVRDTGAGIAPENQERIFEEFQQVDDSNTRQKGGTGLGLAISKSIVELHGGTIRVVSELEVGSTFIVTLPVRTEESREAAE
jgi:GAF domain-containing protein